MPRLLLFFLSLLPLLSTYAGENVIVASPPANTLQKYSYAEPHLGTIVRLIFYHHDKAEADTLAKNCFRKVTQLNAQLSDYKNDSELNELCNKPINEAHTVSNELFQVIKYAQHVSSQSDGAFDITVGKRSKEWRQRKNAEPTPEEQPSFKDIQIHPEQQTITLTKPLQIDLGGIGKGYIADQLMLLVKQANIAHAAVAVGGETIVTNAPPNKEGWKIGVEDPEQNIIGILLIENSALSTSGDSYQFYEINGQRQSHLINPKTQKHKTNRLNVVTIADSAMKADAWSTALRILPTEKALELANTEADLEALFLPHQEQLTKTQNFPTLTRK